jgi:hypothetical protein
MAWKILNLSNTPERICFGVLEGELSQEANLDLTNEDPGKTTENEQ